VNELILAYSGPAFPHKLYEAQSYFTDILQHGLLHKNWYITPCGTAFFDIVTINYARYEDKNIKVKET
jgi:hypothetical protein